MLYRNSPAHHERTADRMLDIAAAIDAGLPASTFGGDPGDGDDMVARALDRAGARLVAGETVALRAAWKAGRAPSGLRQLAARRSQHAEFARSIRSQLLYPVTLAALAFVVSLVAARVGSPRLPWVVGGALGALALASSWVVRMVKAGSERALTLPLVGPLVADFGELSYLETLHACYASGIPLLAANKEAVAACPVVAVRQKLYLADQLAQQGSSVSESLGQMRAVHAETLSLIALGEKSGTLEDSLQRAVTRRRDTARRRAAALAKGIGIVVYALGVVVAAATVISFWSSYAQALRSIR